MITIATPMYDGKCASQYTESLVATVGALHAADIQFNYIVLDRDPFIQRARDRLASSFMASESTDLVFIDADVGWKPESFLKLFEHDTDVVCGVYPKKEEVESYPCAIIEVDGCPVGKCGLIEANRIPTGFTRIQRRVFEELDDHVITYETNGETVKGYFQQAITDGQFIGEDCSFSDRVKSVGGSLWIQPDIEFTHTGLKTYTGNLHKFLGGS